MLDQAVIFMVGGLLFLGAGLWFLLERHDCPTQNDFL